MLKPKEKSKEDWHAIVKTEEGRCTACFLHERNVGLEEEGIVIASNKAIPI